MKPSSGPDAPVKAVFFLEPLPLAAPMIAAWAQAGHEVTAIVLPHRHNARLAWHWTRLTEPQGPHWSLPGMLRRHAPKAPIIRLPYRPRWDMLAGHMCSFDADVLVSAFFPRCIPDGVLGAFRHGGVNLHPSRLPHCRGPAPLHHLLLSNTWREHGGVTLHRMTSKLDEGETIAFAPLADAQWRDRGTLDRALGGAFAALAVNALPAFCRGEIAAKEQAPGEPAWAGELGEMMVRTTWTADQLNRVLAFFGRTPGIWLPVGETRIRLGAAMKAVGPPHGLPSHSAAGTTEFDLADARVACRPEPWLKARSARRRARAEWRQSPPEISVFSAQPAGREGGKT